MHGCYIVQGQERTSVVLMKVTSVTASASPLNPPDMSCTVTSVIPGIGSGRVMLYVSLRMPEAKQAGDHGSLWMLT